MLTTRFKKPKLKSQKGVTLVELLLYMGLLAILLVIMTNLFVSIVELKLESDSTSAIEQDGRFIMSRIIYDINNADSITTPASPGASGGTLVLVNGSETLTYSLSGSNLQLNSSINGSANLNSSEATISGLSFQRLGPSGGRNSIKINFTVTSVTQRKQGTESKNYSYTVGVRN